MSAFKVVDVMTDAEFKERISKFTFSYDLSEVKYTRYEDKVKVTCPKHGTKMVPPQCLLEGRDCQKCSAVKRWAARRLVARRLTVEDAIKQAKEKHGDTYDFSKATFVSHKDKWTLICKVHGEFRQRPEATIAGRGCKKCAAIRKGKVRTLSHTEAIRRAKIANPELDFSRAIYMHSSKKWLVGCKTHGFFPQRPVSTWLGRGCKRCSGTGKRLIPYSEFLVRLANVHGDKYLVVNDEYQGISKPIKMRCKIHGDWDTFGERLVINKSGCEACHHGGVPKLVYFFMLKTQDGFGVKIGLTKDILNRRYQLTRDFGYRPLLLGHILFDDGGHAFKLEQFLLEETGNREVIPLLKNKNTEETRKFSSMDEFKSVIGSLVNEWKEGYTLYKSIDEKWYI